MEPHEQTAVFQAMSAPDIYPHPVCGIEVRETHISRVYLTGDFVYKIKKKVNYGFLDYTTLEKRRFFCDQEVLLNRRLALDVYIDVVAITFERGRFHLDGPGRTVEYAVKMRQLSEDLSLLKLLQHRKLDLIQIDHLARKLADFYVSVPVVSEIARYGSIETIRGNCEENFEQLAEMAATYLDDQQFRIIQAATRSFLSRKSALFLNRITDGKIHDCHGDLRCGHIYFEEGIHVVDCIEFNNRFRYEDVACDLAYLIMDLEYEGFPEVANRLVEAYVRFSGDSDVYVLLDFYKCYRAMVKSKVCCFTLHELESDDYIKKRLQREARKYLSLAYRYAIRFTRPTLWVVCGLVASGKSTIADRLSEHLQVVVLNSDEIRKQLFGVEADVTVDVPFGQGMYSRGATSLTYGKLLLTAQEEIKKGRSVIIDATFSRKQQRHEALQLARDMDVNILFVECHALTQHLKARLKARERKPSVSDARLHHLKQMIDRYEPIEEMVDDLHLRIHTQQPIEENIKTILGYDYYLLSTSDRRH